MPNVIWKTAPCIVRHPANPVLSFKDVPYEAADTVECLATTTVDSLLGLIEKV
jgi:hypothetical protein